MRLLTLSNKMDHSLLVWLQYIFDNWNSGCHKRWVPLTANCACFWVYIEKPCIRCHFSSQDRVLLQSNRLLHWWTIFSLTMSETYGSKLDINLRNTIFWFCMSLNWHQWQSCFWEIVDSLNHMSKRLTASIQRLLQRWYLKWSSRIMMEYNLQIWCPKLYIKISRSEKLATPPNNPFLLHLKDYLTWFE